MSRTLCQLGVNRISLGAQSFQASKLGILERDHSASDIRRAVELTVPFADVSLDLIFGVPGENIDLWHADLDQALALPVQHVSTYGLTFEKGTRYWSARLHGELKQLDEEVERTMYLAAIDRLGSAGLDHYEISNFARPGHRSRHNQVYWSGKEYYAFGPGAARYVDGRRETNHRSTLTYLKRMFSGQSPVVESEQLSPEERAREHLVFQLRMLDGVHKRHFAQVSGYTIEELVRKPLAHYLKHRFMADDGERIRLTRKGLLISDSLWPQFLNS